MIAQACVSALVGQCLSSNMKTATFKERLNNIETSGRPKQSHTKQITVQKKHGTSATGALGSHEPELHTPDSSAIPLYPRVGHIGSPENTDSPENGKWKYGALGGPGSPY